MARASHDWREEFERVLEEAQRAGGTSHRRPALREYRLASPRRDLRLGSPSQVVIAGAVLLLLQWLGLAFFLGPLVTDLGLALLGFGVVSWLIRPPRHESYWRGRRVEWEEGAAWRRRLYFTFYRR